MNLYITRVNKVNGEYVVDRFLEVYNGDINLINDYICKKYQQPESVMLCPTGCQSDAEAIHKINNKWENVLFYEAICKIKEIFECTINDELYIGFDYEDGFRYLAKKDFIYKDKKESSKFYKAKYMSAKKHKKVGYREYK